MILSNFIPSLRERLKDDDNLNGYRFSDIDLAKYIDNAIKQTRIDQPDSQYNPEDGNRFEYVGLWEYIEAGTNTGRIDQYENIINWDKAYSANQTLYFTATTSPAIINIYAETGRTTILGSIPNTDEVGIRPVIPATGQIIAGSVELISEPADNDQWECKALESELLIDRQFILPIIHFAAYLGYADDNEDTHNEKRASYHLAQYQKITG